MTALAQTGSAGSWPQTSGVECVYALVCGACVDVGCSSRLKPVGIREICVQMPKVDIYISISEEQNTVVSQICYMRLLCWIIGKVLL